MAEISSLPLVTIVVITYNSALTLIETLTSCLDQTCDLKKVELVISDDGSVDETAEIASQWLEVNGKSFFCSSLLLSNLNTGVAENCNRGWKKAQGKWIKCIAGDDVLLSNCIQSNIDYVNKNPCRIVFSKVLPFHVTDGKKKFHPAIPSENAFSFFDKSAEGQLQDLLLCNVSGTPSAFIEKNLLDEVGYADARFAFIEDYPLWIKVTESKEKIHFMEEVTVLYRLQDSISRSRANLANLKYLLDMQKIENYILTHAYFKAGFFLRIRKKFWPSILITYVKAVKNRRSRVTEMFFYLLLCIKPLHFRQEVRPKIRFYLSRRCNLHG